MDATYTLTVVTRGRANVTTDPTTVRVPAEHTDDPTSYVRAQALARMCGWWSQPHGVVVLAGATAVHTSAIDRVHIVVEWPAQ